jgi:hypothetical protein
LLSGNPDGFVLDCELHCAIYKCNRLTICCITSPESTLSSPLCRRAEQLNKEPAQDSSKQKAGCKKIFSACFLLKQNIGDGS